MKTPKDGLSSPATVKEGNRSGRPNGALHRATLIVEKPLAGEAYDGAVLDIFEIKETRTSP